MDRAEMINLVLFITCPSSHLSAIPPKDLAGGGGGAVHSTGGGSKQSRWLGRVSVYPPSLPPLHCRVCTDWSGDHYTIDVWRTAGPYPHIRIAAVYKQNVHTCQPWTLSVNSHCPEQRYTLHLYYANSHHPCGFCLMISSNMWSMYWEAPIFQNGWFWGLQSSFRIPSISFLPSSLDRNKTMKIH